MLLLVAWVSTSTYVSPLRGSTGETATPHTDSNNLPRPPDQPASAPHDSGKPVKVPQILDIFFLVMLILFALALMYLLFRRIQQARAARRRIAEAADAVDALDDFPEDLLSENLQRTAERGIARLSEGDARNAIVRCWVMLEDTVAEAGLARDPALTSEEFTAAVLAQYAFTPDVIAELGALYREARFSQHALDEGHRRRAVAALNALRDDLDRPRSTV
jgi:hypothetical protein